MSSPIFAAHWVNPDETKPDTAILLVENYFVITGDQDAMEDSFHPNSAEVVCHILWVLNRCTDKPFPELLHRVLGLDT